MVIRPKSMATVVADLCSTPNVASSVAPALVSTSSVCSGMISLTEATRVVLPTPKPPATKILIAVGTGRAWPTRLERLETIDHRLKYVIVGERAGGVWLVQRDLTQFEQVAQENPDHAEG